MTVKEFMESPDGVGSAPGVRGPETDWLHVCDFKVQGRQITAIDPGPGGDPIEIQVEPGDFVVEAKCIAFGRDKRISRMRVRPNGSEPQLGRCLGTTSVDEGTLAVFDDEPMEAFMADDDEAYGDWLVDELFMPDGPCGSIPCQGGNTTVPYVDAGFGDGAYPAYELTDASGKAVGLEVEFIGPDEDYPF